VDRAAGRVAGAAGGQARRLTAPAGGAVVPVTYRRIDGAGHEIAQQEAGFETATRDWLAEQLLGQGVSGTSRAARLRPRARSCCTGQPG
jgi:hypothetical protein